MKFKRLLIGVASVLVSYSVNSQIWILGGKNRHGSGIISEKQMNVTEFSALRIRGELDVFLVDSLKGKLTIRGDDNLLKYIKVKEKKKGMLIVTNPIVDQLFPKNNKRIEVYLPHETMNMVTLSGSGNLISDRPLSCENLVLRLRGSGKIKVPISVTKINALVSGFGRMTLSGNYEEGRFKTRGSGRISKNGLIETSSNFKELSPSK